MNESRVRPPQYMMNISLWRSAFYKLGAVITLSIGFAYLNRNLLSIDLYEIGDFAANSLLIQHAKHLSLLSGHYSRLGFNHPGPAILYVLAAGEWLFYDSLGWVRAPLAGQVIAVGVYNAFWIVMLATLLIRICRSIAIATVVLLLFLAASAYFDYLVFASLWPPHLFYFPFATFTLAAALMVVGRSDSLIILVISGGFLIHGYVSFFPICGLMLLGVLLIDQFKPAHTKKLITQNFFKENSTILMFVAIFAILFLAPLILDSIYNFPGPIPKYISYSSENPHNSLAKSLQFVADYWNVGISPILFAITVLLFIGVDRCVPKDDLSSGHCFAETAQVLLLATGAFLIFVMYGVDDLTRNFVGLFYYSVPAFSLALLPACVLVQRPRIFQVLVAVPVAALALLYTVQQISKPMGYMGKQYHNAAIPQYFEKIQSLGDATVVLDLDSSQEGGHGQIWSTLLGIQAYAARRNSEDLFCIDKGWHVSFTVEAQCTNQQIARGPRYYLTTSKSHDPGSIEPAIDLNGIGFFEIHRVKLTADHPLGVASNNEVYRTSVLLDGWSGPETDLVWTEAKRARLTFWFDSQTMPSQLTLDLAAFLPLPGQQQAVEITINDTPVDIFHFDAQNNRGKRTIFLQPAMVAADGIVVLQLDIDNPISPKATSQSSDSRFLGVALYGLEIRQ